jgi:hypothetical protein
MVVTSASSSFSLLIASSSHLPIIQVLRIKNANICKERDRYLARDGTAKKSEKNGKFAHTFSGSTMN